MIKKKILKISLLFGFSLVLISSILLLTIKFGFFDKTEEFDVVEEQTEAIMLLIEFEGTTGLENFAYEMKERDIPGLLVVKSFFVEENCEVLKKLQNNGIEIAGSCPEEPLWDVDYDTQYERIKTTKEEVEACTGQPMRVISSRYFAYDENTLKAAEELGIDYVLARGTTGAKSTIYKPTEYDVKIFSVSNVGSEKWGTGSLCDYSYWAREGTPEEFSQELFDAYNTYDKISPVSHTYLGGLKERWFDVYMNFFDNTDIKWLDLDDFGTVDTYASLDEIPVNREVQYTTPKPDVPLEDEVDVDNPCAIEPLVEEETEEDTDTEESAVVMFHNGTGPMCLEAIDFFEENNIKYTEHLTTDSDFNTLLNEYKDKVDGVSEGVSTYFGYYPMIFIGDKAYSGFNEEIGAEILEVGSGS
jgi:hypothetical protein